MREIALFVEDYAHRQVVGALAKRLAHERGVAVELDWRNAVGGHGAVVREFNRYLHDLERQGGRQPDLIVVATDANCKGLNGRAKEFRGNQPPAPLLLAIPDPHIERWLLLDGAAFRTALGRGCQAPDQKCLRDRYKRLLIKAVHEAGAIPNLGGVEFAEDIVREMDLARAAQADGSFGRFVEEFRGILRGWRWR